MTEKHVTTKRFENNWEEVKKTIIATYEEHPNATVLVDNSFEVPYCEDYVELVTRATPWKNLSVVQSVFLRVTTTHSNIRMTLKSSSSFTHNFHF